MFNLYCTTDTLTSEALLPIFTIPFRGAKFLLSSTHRMLKAEGTRVLFNRSLRKFNPTIRNATFLRDFGVLKLIGLIGGEAILTFIFGVLAYLFLLILAGFWTYISQEHLTKIGTIFMYLPIKEIGGGLIDAVSNIPYFDVVNDFYTNNIKDLILEPNKVLTKWEVCKKFITGFFTLASFKMAVSIAHDWPTYVHALKLDIFPNLSLYNIGDSILLIFLAFAAQLKFYFIVPTFKFISSIILMPLLGFNNFINSNWVGEIVWLISSYFTKFQELYWKYVWGYKYSPKTIWTISEFYYNSEGEKVYSKDTSGHVKSYETKEAWINSKDNDEILKLVEGESFEVRESSNTVQDVTNTVTGGTIQPEPIQPVKTEPININTDVPTNNTDAVASGSQGVKRPGSPAHEEAEEITKKWSEDKTSSEGESSPIGKTNAEKQKQYAKYFVPADPEQTPKNKITELTPEVGTGSVPNEETGNRLERVDILGSPKVQQAILNYEHPIRENPILSGAGVYKNGQVYYYEKDLKNIVMPEGGPDVFKIEPNPEHEIQGVESWRHYLMTNPKVITFLCFSSTMVASYAIKSVIRLGVDTVILVLN